MKVRILDASALNVVTPRALAAYSGSVGWAKVEPYGDVADVWSGKGLPEIVLPRTNRLGDYASVVSRLIEIFSEERGQDELAVLKDLLEAEHDVIRVRVIEGATNGSIALDTGVEMVSQAREMVLAAARATVGPPQRVYRGRANKKATAFMERVRLGQTEHGSFVVSLMAPVAPTTATLWDDSRPWLTDEPLSRRVVLRLIEALQASRQAAERWSSGSFRQEFDAAISAGVSANLCDAVVNLIESTDRFDVSVAWATSRAARLPPARIEFSEAHRIALKAFAQALRIDGPRPEIPLLATVHRLTRDQGEFEGVVVLKTEIDGRIYSVNAVLDEENYRAAIRAHETGRRVIVDGDLERIGQRWRITNASLRTLPVRPKDQPRSTEG